MDGMNDWGPDVGGSFEEKSGMQTVGNELVYGKNLSQA